MKNLAILGSTGSIGLSTLAIVRAHPDQFAVKVLAARKNAGRLFEQAVEFRPDVVCLFEDQEAAELKNKLLPFGIKVRTGLEGLLEASRYEPVDEVVFALVGAVGLLPIFEAIRAGKAVAIANKEPLVIAGDLVINESRKYGVPIFPIDSEHSALWQCLEGRPPGSIKKLILTSSGGPFYKRKGNLDRISPSEALKHPKWKMGPKITIDSATLMNKGLEVIEASHLFQTPAERIEVLIHPEAIVHGMVEFVDGSHLAHLGITDMRLPIQYALSYPDRLVNHLPTLDFSHLQGLHFDKPDFGRFPCLGLGYEASRIGGSMPAVLNAANE
ncbi:MAG TPA: 1-deoxy-D-xylulose-5-phosphate reductoisomerase, partial [bacterium]|nr:1-deoxy-D-xylulose-5-phosphate reductoisomerase [bacterium]